MTFQKAFSIRIGALVGIAAMFAGLIYALGGDMVRRREIAQAGQEELASRAQLFESLVSLRAGAIRAEALAPRLEEILPDEGQLLKFTKTVEALARFHQVETKFIFGGGGSAETAGAHAFVLTASGAFGTIIRFIKAIEESPYITSFSSFELTRGGNVFSMVARGKVYSQ